ncbi:MAG: CHAT domain-containing tetratricopeptide repeat protein [Croceibacterium sp.]
MREYVSRFVGTVFAAGLLIAALPATATTPVESESFAVGTDGALCQAQGVMLGQARVSLFDRKWALLCSDVDRPVGAAYSWKGARIDGDRLGRGRDTQINCGEATSAADLAPGAMVRHCREAGSNLEWNSYEVASGGWLHVVEGLSAFDGALRLALANLVQGRIVPGEVDIVSTGGSGSLAQALASLGSDEQLIGQGYRQNNAGEYTQAEAFFRPDLLGATTAGVSVAERRHEATVNRGLQLSNLGRYDEASRAFAAAHAMAVSDGIQARLLRNFEAIDALNRGAFDEVAPILARRVPDVSVPTTDPSGAVAIEPRLAQSLNAGATAGLVEGVGQSNTLTRAERAAILDGQARQLAGSTLRLQGKTDEALAELARAREAIVSVRGGRVISTARLQAQILSEMALAQEAGGQYGEAGTQLRAALAIAQRNYPESASVDAAKARLAAFLTRRGDRTEAMGLYREIVANVVDKRDGLVGIENQIKPYLTMLVEQLPQQPELVNDLFLATQLVERPGAAQTLAQLTRKLSAGSGEASDLYRRANSVDRELARVNLTIAQSQAQAQDAGTTAVVADDLLERRQRLEGIQLELLNSLAAFPAYRSVAHNYVNADDLKSLLAPGEGYLKLVRLGDEMFAVYLSQTRSAGWKVGASSAQVADLVSALRNTISLTIGGVNATYPFDVDSSRKLYDDLFGPVSGDIAQLNHLVFEPDGALLQLPINLLTADQAGVDAYHTRVAQGGDEFDFRGIGWLGRGKAISTALSPASFRDARRAPASVAGHAYLGLGRNAPVGPVTRAALTRGVDAQDVTGTETGCEFPLASWNRPIPDDELQQAAQVFGPADSSLMTGAAFTDTAISQRQDLNSFRIVHFATHGLVTAPRQGCPARPALLTSFGGAGSDGLLEFADVFDLNLDADLVILSACDTASFAGLEATREAGIESGGGQALDGLVRAFIGAGGRQVIASHWPAPEEYGATRRLFASFFESPAGVSQGDALRKAQEALMDDPETSHPFYWAGFALIGDGERPLFHGS